jgi:hypothetical protein
MLCRRIRRRRSRSAVHLRRARRLGLLDLLRVDAEQDGQHGELELGHGQPEAREHARLPARGDALLGEDRREVGDGAAEDGQYRGRAGGR